MLNDFETALRKLHRAGRKQFGDDWVPELKRRRVKLETAYATLWEQDRDPIAYASMSAQAAYVFAYAPVRAEYTRQYLTRHRQALGQPLFPNTHARVVSFGGGPGSELVGLVRYLEDDSNAEPVESIEYSVYDKDGDWDDVAATVVAGLKTDITIQMRYDAVDAASRTRMGQIDLSDTDLVMFSYIMSELARLGRKDQIAENFRSTLSNLKLNSKILFIDNLHPIFIQYFHQCKLVTGLMQKNDDDAAIICDFGDFPETFQVLSQALEWIPRTELRSVSKLIARNRL